MNKKIDILNKNKFKIKIKLQFYSTNQKYQKKNAIILKYLHPKKIIQKYRKKIKLAINQTINTRFSINNMCKIKKIKSHNNKQMKKIIYKNKIYPKLITIKLKLKIFRINQYNKSTMIKFNRMI